jgi:hypothetical protein
MSARLEDLTGGAQVKGVRNDGPVEVVDTKWFGGTRGPTWNFDADGSLLCDLVGAGN